MINFKFELGQEVFTLTDGIVRGKIYRRMYDEDEHGNYICYKVTLFLPCGNDQVGIRESSLFLSPEEVAADLVAKYKELEE